MAFAWIGVHWRRTVAASQWQRVGVIRVFGECGDLDGLRMEVPAAEADLLKLRLAADILQVIRSTQKLNRIKSSEIVVRSKSYYAVAFFLSSRGISMYRQKKGPISSVHQANAS